MQLCIVEPPNDNKLQPQGYSTMLRTFLAHCTLAAVVLGGCSTMPGTNPSSVTLIHTGDFHGHLVPRADVRGAVEGRPMGTVGGLARVASVVKGIRSEVPGALLVNTGDTIQGSAEALYTRGEALVDVVDMLGVDAFVPGNWDFVYGTARFLEFFGGPQSRVRWNTVSANLFYSTAAQDATTPFPDKAGQRVVPPYLVKQVGSVKVGILGLTADRGPQVVPRAVTKGFYFLPNGKVLHEEVARQVAQLRDVEKVDLLVLASEMGLANNVVIAERVPGIDVVLSSDMHEASMEPIVVTGADGRKTLLVEEGQDGTQVGRIDVEVAGGKIASWKWKRYAIDDSVAADAAVAAKIEGIRRPFLSGPAFVAQRNPFNGSLLKRPIDTVVGRTAVPLLRENFTGSALPGVVGGSSHYMLTDAPRRARRGRRRHSRLPLRHANPRRRRDPLRGSLSLHPHRPAARRGHGDRRADQIADRGGRRRLPQPGRHQVDRRLALRFQRLAAHGFRSLRRHRAARFEHPDRRRAPGSRADLSLCVLLVRN